MLFRSGRDFERLEHVEVHDFGRASLINENPLNHCRANPESNDQSVVVGELDLPEVSLYKGNGPP